MAAGWTTRGLTRLISLPNRFGSARHFFAVAAEMIRLVLVYHARGGGRALRIDLSDVDAAQGSKDVELITLDRLLSALATLDAAQARMVELRYFGGLTFDEIAEALEMSPSAAKRAWGSASLWLRWRLSSDAPPEADHS